MVITQPSHLNTGPFANWTTFYHLNTRLVQYLDGYCIWKLLITFFFYSPNAAAVVNQSLIERLSRSASVRETGNGSRKAASVGANVFDRLAKGAPASLGASGTRRGSGALETLTSPRAVSAVRSPLTDEKDNRRTNGDLPKRGALTKIRDLVRYSCVIRPFNVK